MSFCDKGHLEDGDKSNLRLQKKLLTQSYERNVQFCYLRPHLKFWVSENTEWPI